MVKNKLAVINVLADIIRSPLLLLDPRYPLTPDDFPERFHRIVYGAVDYLVKHGVTALDEVVIDDYLSQYPLQHQIFEDNRGMEYLSQATALSDPSNFAYYYETLRKCSLLTRLEACGYNIHPFYDPDAVHPDEQQEVQEKMDACTIEDILNHYELELSDMKLAFSVSAQTAGCQAADGAEDLVASYKTEPEMGMPTNSPKMTTICRGRRLKKFYLRTLPSGMGKSRISAADACLIAVPTYFDPDTKRWVHTGYSESVLFITTELEIDEVQTLFIAYVACVPEEHILDGQYDAGEEERVHIAIEAIAKSRLYIEHMPNFVVDDVEAMIKRYKLKARVGYVFFDYIFSSIRILAETASKTRGMKLREDNVLVMFADRMKTICNQLNVHIDTSTQANGDWKTTRDPDQNLIRGAKGMADKADVGYVGMPPTEKDMEAIHLLMTDMGRSFTLQPNLVYHIYKVRRGKLNHVKLFVYFDYATLRTRDLFVTTQDYKLINVPGTFVEVR